MISDRPEAGHKASCSSGEECAADTGEFIARVDRVASGLAAREEHDLGVEIKVDDIAYRHPSVGELESRRVGKGTDKAPVASEVNH
jgi:hypothetical protein